MRSNFSRARERNHSFYYLKEKKEPLMAGLKPGPGKEILDGDQQEVLAEEVYKGTIQ